MGSVNGHNSTVIQVTNDGMGIADGTLQHALLRKYLVLLHENSPLPESICFYASGVKMVVEGSPVLDLLQSLELLGVRMIACRTCLSYYGLLDAVRVGAAGEMRDIVAAQWSAEKVITI